MMRLSSAYGRLAQTGAPACGALPSGLAVELVAVELPDLVGIHEPEGDLMPQSDASHKIASRYSSSSFHSGEFSFTWQGWYFPGNTMSIARTDLPRDVRLPVCGGFSPSSRSARAVEAVCDEVSDDRPDPLKALVALPDEGSE